MWIIPAAPKEASAIAGAGAVMNEDAFCTCDSSTKCALQQRPGLHAAMSLCGTRNRRGRASRGARKAVVIPVANAVKAT